MNYYYKNTIKGFLNDNKKVILKELTFYGGNDPMQLDAWEYEIHFLKRVLVKYKNDTNSIIFEYTIPRLHKRVDVILLIKGIVYVLEFKVGSDIYDQYAVDQVLDYALDLKNFHKESENKYIIPVLIATKAKDTTIDKVLKRRYDNLVYDPICVNGNYVYKAIDNTLSKVGSKKNIDLNKWIKSRYEPTPTIIEAASSLYLNHTVEDITKHEASAKQIDDSVDCLLDIIEYSKKKKRKSICFVTGVPGAGKTLVGLDVAIKQRQKDSSKDNLAVYLSGNGPLVKVLTAALAKDKVDREQIVKHKKYNLTDAKREVKSFIQDVYAYREQMLKKIDLTSVKKGILKVNKKNVLSQKKAGYAEIEHIAIFDEAQRSWNHQKLSSWLERGGSYGNKMKVHNFPMSEAEFLIWSLDLRKDWAVIICLVGGGQEIHDGEAGIGEWIKAITGKFKNWDIYVSGHLTDKEYAEGKVKKLLNDKKNVEYIDKLHLPVSMRSYRSEKLSKFVNHLLDLKIKEAKEIYQSFKTKYPIVLTRNINDAKKWLKKKARGNERYGIIVSSKAERLRPLAIDVKREIEVEHWFLEDKKDLRSSCFLEDVATEFDVQGLELDYACITWDGDLRLVNNKWDFNNFRTNNWQKVNKKENQEYQLNAYRVLLTRARQGMVICVPEGSDDDDTRKPVFYDGVYKYLKKIGLDEI